MASTSDTTSRPVLPASHVSVSGALSTEPGSASPGRPPVDGSISRQSTSSQLTAPELPPRPASAPPYGDHDGSSSAPPSPALLQQPTKTVGNIDLQNVPTNAISSPENNNNPLTQDEKTSSRASRFFGNMLISRVGRASWQSLESTARLPFYLSPWGDNQPITLPNLRKRDIALAGVAHLGLEALGASAVNVVEAAFEHAVSSTVEQGADEGITKLSGSNNKGHTVQRRVGMNSLTLRIRHKMIGEAAELVFQGLRDTDDRMGCAKGWFCPYLYASGREPEIARAHDFAMAQLLTPRLAADLSIAPTLLSAFAESDTPVVSPFGPWEGGDKQFGRMAVLVTGISPYRYVTTQTAWAHARIPNEARITFHLFTHVPAVVIPVRDQSPVFAWSPWTVAQMLDTKTTAPYDVGRHVKELLDFIGTVIDEEAVRDYSAWRDTLEACLLSMLNSVRSVPDAIRKTAKECCELERTGVVAFRY